MNRSSSLLLLALFISASLLLMTKSAQAYDCTPNAIFNPSLSSYGVCYKQGTPSLLTSYVPICVIGSSAEVQKTEIYLAKYMCGIQNTWGVTYTYQAFSCYSNAICIWPTPDQDGSGQGGGSGGGGGNACEQCHATHSNWTECYDVCN